MRNFEDSNGKQTKGGSGENLSVYCYLLQQFLTSKSFSFFAFAPILCCCKCSLGPVSYSLTFLHFPIFTRTLWGHSAINGSNIDASKLGHLLPHPNSSHHINTDFPNNPIHEHCIQTHPTQSTRPLQRQKWQIPRRRHLPSPSAAKPPSSSPTTTLLTSHTTYAPTSICGQS